MYFFTKVLRSWEGQVSPSRGIMSLILNMLSLRYLFEVELEMLSGLCSEERSRLDV